MHIISNHIILTLFIEKKLVTKETYKYRWTYNAFRLIIVIVLDNPILV